MVRKLILVLAMLAVAAVPAQAVERELRGGHDRVEQERFRGVERPNGRAFTRSGYVDTPQCYWQPAYWVNHVYPNGYGGHAYVPQFIPGQWVCG